ncbi:MAG: hypothetical protein VX938_11985, partial [Myxococcota bacterium]|nr:hypothetical protein [Myxococcota bacterium]
MRTGDLRLWALVAVLSSWGFLGCEDQATEGSSAELPGAIGAPCGDDGGCETGLACVEALCAEVPAEPDTKAPLDGTTNPPEPDVTVEDTAGPDECTDEGCFGTPCDGPDDCFSGLCAPHMGDEVCTQTCEAECPAGWSCSLIALGGGDPSYICVSNFAHLCLPCLSADDCATG